jgi:hypothetical protein
VAEHGIVPYGFSPGSRLISAPAAFARSQCAPMSST